MRYPNAFPYPGAKYNLARYIKPFFPPHRTYIEVFGGAGNLLIQKDPSEREIFNDIDSGISDFFKILVTRYDEFISTLKILPMSSELLKYAIYGLKHKTFTPFEKALWFFYRQVFSFSSLGKSMGIQTEEKGYLPEIYNRKVENLQKIAQRFKNVIIENRSFEDIFKLYDSKGVFFYLDPPYVLRTREDVLYHNEFSDADHIKLCEILLNCKGRFILSGYDNEIYNKILKDFRKEYINWSQQINSKGTNKKRVEVLWIK